MRLFATFTTVQQGHGLLPTCSVVLLERGGGLFTLMQYSHQVCITSFSLIFLGTYHKCVPLLDQ